MSEATADIVGTTGANFAITVTSGTVTTAFLKVQGKADVPLTVGPGGQAVTVPSLTSGDSKVRLDIVWAPGDVDAVIDVGNVSSGSATAATPKGTLEAGKTPGFVDLFGK
jgi:hypothetical protein